MKILIIQLARLGDIYMTWPVLRALRRQHPEAELHILTRPRFEPALKGLDAIDKHLSLSGSTILAPLVQEEPDIAQSLTHLQGFIEGLKKEKYDQVINLTFSPVSSYLTHAVSHETTQVLGYSRHRDGSLCLSDEISAYFYAQVGVGKANRVHLTDVFASMLDIQYVEEDWRAPAIAAAPVALPDNYVVLHIGASEKHKALSASHWSEVLNQLQPEWVTPVVLIGATEETSQAEQIQKTVRAPLQVINLVGRTQISDLFSILQGADMLIGCDSAPIHMASLTDTPTFNVSVGEVNYWETGPKASLGFIYRVEGQGVNPLHIAICLKSLFRGAAHPALMTRTGGLVSYHREESPAETFQWNLIRALYLGGPYPLAERMEILQGAMKLEEVNSFAKEQIALVSHRGLEVVGPLLDRAEEVIENISRWVPELGPLISWYQAEKIRIAPGSLEEICSATLSVHDRLARHLQVYIPHENMEEVDDGAL
ncbi:MAG: glycosyltransferase family 9 protein [Bdellovibrio sp.]